MQEVYDILLAWAMVGSLFVALVPNNIAIKFPVTVNFIGGPLVWLMYGLFRLVEYIRSKRKK